MATTSLRASGFILPGGRKTFKEIMDLVVTEPHGYHWSNWGRPSAEDLGLTIYTVVKSGWEWGVLAGCVIINRPFKKADGTMAR